MSNPLAGRSWDPIFLRSVVRDGLDILLGRCPGCGEWGELDNDMAHGRVSTACPLCEFHETKNWMRDHTAPFREESE